MLAIILNVQAIGVHEADSLVRKSTHLRLEVRRFPYIVVIYERNVLPTR
jgi:hypothetical protein